MRALSHLALATILAGIVFLSVRMARGGDPPPLRMAPAMRISTGCSCLSGDKCGCKECFCGPSYEEARRAAIKDNSPLVVFVKQRPRTILGAVATRLDSFPGHDYPAVVVGVPDGQGNLIEYDFKESFPDDNWIQSRIREWRNKRKRISFLLIPAFQPACVVT